MSTPIKPSELKKKFPDEVIDAFNDLIQIKWVEKLHRFLKELLNEKSTTRTKTSTWTASSMPMSGDQRIPAKIPTVLTETAHSIFLMILAKTRIRSKFFMEGPRVIQRWVVEISTEPRKWTMIGTDLGVTKYTTKEEAEAGEKLAVETLKNVTHG